MIYKTLIIGAGKQGALCDIPGSGNEYKIISHAKAFDVHTGFELVGFYDTNEQTMLNAAIEWETNWFHSLDEAWDAYDIDVVSICTPDETHYDVLEAVLKYNPKLVLCEKPIATNLTQATKIVAKYKVKKIPILVDYTRRFIPRLQLFKQRVDRGEFGKFLWGFGAFNRGWLHSMTHMVDFLLWVLGDLDNFYVREVKSTKYRAFQVHLFFENQQWTMKTGDGPVDPIYDLHMFYVVDNIYNYLEKSAPLLCTGEDALKALSLTVDLKRRASDR